MQNKSQSSSFLERVLTFAVGIDLIEIEIDHFWFHSSQPSFW